LNPASEMDSLEDTKAILKRVVSAVLAPNKEHLTSEMLCYGQGPSGRHCDSISSVFFIHGSMLPKRCFVMEPDRRVDIGIVPTVWYSYMVHVAGEM